MPYRLEGRTVQRVGVIGSGNVGPDIALFFARALGRHGVPVVVHDVDARALEAGRQRVLRKLREGGESGVFRPVEAEAIERSLTFTLDKSLLVGCCFAVEAVPENLDVKRAAYEELERILPSQGILASTSSHFEPERLFERLRRPERAVVHRFLYPAERNPVIEIVPGPRTQVAEWSALFYENLGKIPVRARGRWGYAVNPLFEGMILSSLLLEAGGLPPAVIDAIVCRLLKTSSGPFTTLNLSGASAVVRTGLEGASRAVMPWFHVPPSLDEHLATGQAWRTADKGDTVSYSDTMYEDASRRLLGAYFGLAAEIVENGVASIADLEIAADLGLGLTPPFALMNSFGPDKVRGLVAAYAAEQPGFRVPSRFGPWEIPHVLRQDRDGVAVLTLRRPRLLNAVSLETCRQLGGHLDAISADPSVRALVLTGFGLKSFSSGEEVGTLASIASPEEAAAQSRAWHRLTRRIETLGKPSVAALNGLSLAAGSELAYACTARIARKGLPVAFGHPEVRLGLVPAAGATQRLPRLAGFPTAWRLLRTGSSLSSQEAAACGLLREEVEGNVLERAVRLARELALAGPLPPPLVPPVPSEVDLHGLSRKVDEILRRAILDGARLELDAALEVEARAFAEVWNTRDRRIGLETFQRTKGRQSAPFIHQ